MKTLYKEVKLIYPGTPEHGRKFDVLVENGLIKKIGKGLTVKADSVKDQKGLLCFPGLMDTQCSVGEPGFEHKESFDSLTKAAKAGGFTDVILLPNTEPVVDNRAQIEFVQRASGTNGVTLHAYGAITKSTDGKELSEMFDMHQSGAVAFSDGKKPITDVNMMKRALDYTRSFDGIVVSYPMDDRIAPGGMVNESESNTLLGLKSTPELAEEIMLNRDLYLLNYTKGRMHVSSISTTGSLSLIKQAKKDGLGISCAVTLASLLFDEGRLEEFDTNFKTQPPLRSVKTSKALLKAISLGLIDVISADHLPQEIESKDVEFDHASFGMTMLETALSAINMNLIGEVAWDDIIRALAINPRNIFGLPQPKFSEKSSFDFTVFDPNSEWEYTVKNCFSKSHNSPYINQTLRGKVISN
ncbi:MAG: dihydroorotase [Flavobacteriales bacterium]|jgi:dihydroorotase|nr:dihydroorotase [Flavobacteriales bacterium]MBT3964084.1 dihydroorotase [Flavobacteriales bacterium]MBT4704080.1 dihydroorotase [Flavobacteriales bacterium]MBT4930727.1 dihydroorotase [Flavobacteriales bacterium]MBT5977561.1 dihydroorotase [Flavobacteriales bacterium]